MNELAELVKGLERIETAVDDTLIAMQGNSAVVTKIPVIYKSKEGHTCSDPENCTLNTSDFPYWCMVANDNSDRE